MNNPETLVSCNLSTYVVSFFDSFVRVIVWIYWFTSSIWKTRASFDNLSFMCVKFDISVWKVYRVIVKIEYICKITCNCYFQTHFRNEKNDFTMCSIKNYLLLHMTFNEVLPVGFLLQILLYEVLPNK